MCNTCYAKYAVSPLDGIIWRYSLTENEVNELIANWVLVPHRFGCTCGLRLYKYSPEELESYLE